MMNKEDKTELNELLTQFFATMSATLKNEAMERETAYTEKLHELKIETNNLRQVNSVQGQKIDVIFTKLDKLNLLAPKIETAVTKITTIVDNTKDQEIRLRSVENECANCGEFKADCKRLLTSMDELHGGLKVWKWLVGALAASGTVVSVVSLIVALS